MTREQEQLVLALLEQVTPLLHRYAVSATLDYDDLYQDASILIMDIIARRGVHALPSYVWVSVRNRILTKVKYHRIRQAVSLDAPITADQGNLTLADVLPSPYRVDPLTLVLGRERIEELLRRPRRKFCQARVVRELGETALASLL
ncbi:MAG: hypothetical protein JO202_02290 [Ktedonobacteraceae bacterium]|nr:hypothetical protein [Ktedonobacteraceae bacterium]